MLEAHWEKYNDEPIEDAQDLVDCLYNESDKARRNNNNETPAAEKNGLKSHLDRKKLECNGHGVASKDDISNKYDQYEKSSYQGSVFNPIYSADKETEFELQKRIIYNVGDIFGAGFDTLFSTLYWSLLYMAVYPDTQVKVSCREVVFLNSYQITKLKFYCTVLVLTTFMFKKLGKYIAANCAKAHSPKLYRRQVIGKLC